MVKPSHQLIARKENIQRLRSKVPLPTPLNPTSSAKKRPQTQKKQRDPPSKNEYPPPPIFFKIKY